jgi:endonuclease/exonuclease/phosphatase family metal-dependent hydrolase
VNRLAAFAVAALAIAAAAIAESGQPAFLQRPAETVRLISYNVEWDMCFPDEDADRAAAVARVLRAVDPDIVCLQEIRRSAEETRDLIASILPLEDGQWYAHKGADCVIVSKWPLRLQAEATEPAGERDLCMALVDLPRDGATGDLYILNNHYKCCGGYENDFQRQQQSDAIIAWMRDAMEEGGAITLRPGTPMLVLGDLNIVGGPDPIDTLITGDIRDNNTYGPDTAPDWDGTYATDARPTHNAASSDAYTWRNDDSEFPPGRLDYIIYTDSVLQVVHGFVLNTTEMSPDQLGNAGLERLDVTRLSAGNFDHLPLIVDIRRTSPNLQAAAPEAE